MYLEFVDHNDYITEDEKNELRENLLLLECSIEDDIWDEEFIREVLYSMPITLICEYQHLSEDFIREFVNEVSWIMISNCQKFSFEFAKEFKTKLNWVLVEENTRIDPKERKKIVKFLKDPKNF